MVRPEIVKTHTIPISLTAPKIVKKISKGLPYNLLYQFLWGPNKFNKVKDTNIRINRSSTSYFNNEPKVKAKSQVLNWWFKVSSSLLYKGRLPSMLIPHFLILFLVTRISLRNFQANNCSLVSNSVFKYYWKLFLSGA